MKVTSNIFQVGGSDHSHSADAAIFLISGGAPGNEAALIDAGTGHGHKEVIKNVESCGVSPGNIKHLFITHCHYDHTGGISKIREATSCEVIAHALDAVYIEKGDSEVTAAKWYGEIMDPTPVDIKVKDREAEFVIGEQVVRFYHTPGHSPGSSVLTTISDGKLVLFGQDVHGPLNDAILSNREDYIKSLEFMISLGADIICEGHFGIFHGKENVKRYIESYL